jgi:hypothetical protein
MFEIDKLYHFLAGIVIGLLGCYFFIPKKKSFTWIVLFVLMAAVVKEFFDFFYQKEDFEILDILATMSSLLIVYPIFLFFRKRL